MIIPITTVKVRLTIMSSTVSSVQSNIHQYDIEKLYNEYPSNSFELCWFVSGHTSPVFSNDYYFTFSHGIPTAIVFRVADPANTPYYLYIMSDGKVQAIFKTMPSDWLYNVESDIQNNIIPDYLRTSGLSDNTFTVGYSSGRLCVEFQDEATASFLFSVWAVGDTTGNAEQVFCTKVPSKNFLAKSTPSLFTVSQDSENTNLYYIACKTSGYTTTLNVTKIIDTSGGMVSLYMEESGGGG